jgi:hypothetical protein
MLSLKREQSGPKRSSRQFRLRGDVIFQDLSLFASLWIARLIIGRELRRRGKQRATRLKRIKLVQPENENLNGLPIESSGELP